jgi:hypothetical protein
VGIKFERISSDPVTTTFDIRSSSGAIEDSVSSEYNYTDIYDLDSETAIIHIQCTYGIRFPRDCVYRFSLRDVTGDFIANATLTAKDYEKPKLAWTSTSVSLDFGSVYRTPSRWWRVELKKAPGFRRPPSLAITSDPNQQVFATGQIAVMEVKGSGNGPISYSWFGGTPPSKGPVLGSGERLTVEAGVESTNYWVEATNPFGSTNYAFQVAVPKKPRITSEPSDVSVFRGQAAALEIGASGEGTLGYQWFSGATPSAGISIIGATNPRFEVGQMTAEGTYHYFATVTDVTGVVTSRVVTVSVLPIPAVSAAVRQDGLLQISLHSKALSTWLIEWTPDFHSWNSLSELVLDQSGNGLALVLPSEMKASSFFIRTRLK